MPLKPSNHDAVIAIRHLSYIAHSVRGQSTKPLSYPGDPPNPGPIFRDRPS